MNSATPPGPIGERRRHQRVPYAAQVTCLDALQTESSYRARDLSVGGIALSGGRRPPTRSLVKLQLVPDDGEAVLPLAGEVVRHDEEGLFAVRFVGVEDEQEQRLQRMVEARQARRKRRTDRSRMPTAVMDKEQQQRLVAETRPQAPLRRSYSDITEALLDSVENPDDERL